VGDQVLRDRLAARDAAMGLRDETLSEQDSAREAVEAVRGGPARRVPGACMDDRPVHQ
jgi:hypothetical protein